MKENIDNQDIVFTNWQYPPLLMIKLDPNVASTIMGRTVGEGAIWPTEAEVKAKRVPIALVENLLDSVIEWIREVVREEFVPKDLTERLVAAQGIINGQDAFLAAWVVGERPFRIAVTRKRLHVLSLLDTADSKEDMLRPQAGRIATQAIVFANTTLRLPELLSPDQEEARIFGSAVLLSPAAKDVPAWYETLVLLARERTIKASILREYGGGSPPSGGSLGSQPLPWFPVQ